LNGSLAFLFGKGANRKKILANLIAETLLVGIVEIMIATLIYHLSIKRNRDGGNNGSCKKPGK
jgi:hypothetical protein